MPETTAEQLSRVQDAISKIEMGGQDVTYNGRRITYANLDFLYSRETTLLARLKREERGGLRVRTGIPE